MHLISENESSVCEMHGAFSENYLAETAEVKEGNPRQRGEG